MSAHNVTSDPGTLAARVDALPGMAEIRSASGDRRVFLVGGSVRDLLLGEPHVDVDLAVEGDAVAFAADLGGAVEVHSKFGTAKVMVADLEVDIAATRAESYERPGALPEVTPAGLDADLRRRDFTVNAMAIDLGGANALVDPFNGAADLEAGVLRILHGDSFADDPTRALRGARYAARIGLAPDEATMSALERLDLSTVSADRVADELALFASEPEPAAALQIALGWGAVDADPARGSQAIRLASSQEWDFLDPVVALLSGSGASAGHYSAPAAGPRAEQMAGIVDPRPSEGEKAARGASALDLLEARLLGAEWIDRYVTDWRQVALEITGADLLAAGIEAGPAVGRGLEAALAARLDEGPPGAERELEIALAAAHRA